MPLHVVIGAGGTGAATARLLAEGGERVRLVTRSGSGPEHPLIERVALDATDTGALARAAEGAGTVFNAAMTAYHTWPQTLPPLFTSILTAAERTGADYVMLGNLYAYGPVDGPVTEDLPLAATGSKGRVRAELWHAAKEAHDAGRVRVTEVRAGQFVGAGAVSAFSLIVQPNVLAGRLALAPADLDAPHGFTAIGDAARTLVAVARDDRSWGRAWHAPTINVSVREVAGRLAELAGAPAPRLDVMTDRDLALLGFGNPFWNELFETQHMSHRPFEVDSSAVETAFGLTASPLDAVLKETLG
ncbi:NAD-dependent epimerase/dehydratase family protein [Actinomadura opuntiae]|uniref:NAD-dependent epimerase/dehydratase family protein n=1 Tax=Actinomadura sp. OS1-43 TaxID=604315 RepID=UPI00255A937B|nr:NAD-dependent epimerase/dehydratase family protein [Actinomadura sp. OS1-43]MDL4816104.1 NAD-dependent epimerase/dehydratase family protein [Actinomadura sp. OS1-43]